jgi:Domain of unknown function (DUF4388)
MSLSGTLNDLSLPNLIQVVCMEKRRACVRVTRHEREGILLFSDGELIHAHLGKLTGEQVVYELLTWDDGGFEVFDELPNLPRNVFTPWSNLVLEGMHKLDEARVEPHPSFMAALSKNVLRYVPLEHDWLGLNVSQRTAVKNVLIWTIGLVLLTSLSVFALTIFNSNRQLETRVARLATQVTLLRMPSATPSPALLVASVGPIATAETQTPFIPDPPTATLSPSTTTPTPTIIPPTPVIWQFQGYVLQWSGSRQTSNQGIGDMTVLLLESCTATFPLDQTKTDKDGRFIIEYDFSARLTPPAKFCVKVLPGSLWNLAKASQPTVNWKEVSPSAVESMVPLDSSDKVGGQNLFFFTIKRTFTARILDEQLASVPGARASLRVLQNGVWSDVMTTTVRSDGTFTLTHESPSLNGTYYQIRPISPFNYEPSPKLPTTVDSWRVKPDGDPPVQIAESTKPIDGTDSPLVVTFYQRLKVLQQVLSQSMNLYSDATGPTVRAILLPQTSFWYKIISRDDKRTHILIWVATSQYIPAKTGLVNPEKPPDIKDATFGLARMPIYIVAIDLDNPTWGWIDGYVDN